MELIKNGESCHEVSVLNFFDEKDCIKILRWIISVFLMYVCMDTEMTHHVV